MTCPSATIVKLIVGKTLKLSVLGIGAGLVAAFFLTRFLATILFGVTEHDPISFLVVPICLLFMALLAGYVPARRATRIDPAASLRCE